MSITKYTLLSTILFCITNTSILYFNPNIVDVRSNLITNIYKASSIATITSLAICQPYLIWYFFNKTTTSALMMDRIFSSDANFLDNKTFYIITLKVHHYTN